MCINLDHLKKVKMGPNVIQMFTCETMFCLNKFWVNIQFI